MGDANISEEHVDVLVVGGGPVGLLTAYQLARTLPTTARIKIIEQHPKSTQDAYGRAITLFPRTSELLDQLGLADALAQQCFACRSTAAYDAAGREVQGRGWSFLEKMQDTKWDFALVLRQRHQEEVLRRALKEVGAGLDAPTVLTGVRVDETVGAGGYRVVATVQRQHSSSRSSAPPSSSFPSAPASSETVASTTIKARYLVAADGGRSTVRRALHIPFDGTATTSTWLRIDGLVRSNIPTPRAYCAIESPTHGNVLWAPLDRGGTRIGFALPSGLKEGESVEGGLGKGVSKESGVRVAEDGDQQEQGQGRRRERRELNEQTAVAEAIKAVQPFTLSFDRVDWWTAYTVNQRIARYFSIGGSSSLPNANKPGSNTHDCIFLAGDAAHTHSSGAAQGLNTGLHDSVNLSWKLSLVLRRLAHPSLLSTYARERRPNVEKLLAYDRDIARLMSGGLPEGWTGDEGEDPNVVLGVVMEEAAAFSSGLGVGFEIDGVLNVLNAPQAPDAPGSDAASAAGSASSASSGPTSSWLRPGLRAPDVPLLKPGTFEQTRLQRETPNLARFYVVVFAGLPAHTASSFAAFKTALEASRFFAPSLSASSSFTASSSSAASLSSAAEEPSSTTKQDEKSARPISYLTIPIASRATAASAYELLGNTAPLGRMFYDFPSSSTSSSSPSPSSNDVEGSQTPTAPAHARYAVNAHQGAVYVLRPDGWIGTVVGLGEEGVRGLEGYFKGFLV